MSSLLTVNRILLTKDGRKIGNCIIVKITTDKNSKKKVYTVRTDYGGRAKFTSNQIRKHFYKGDLAKVREGKKPHKHMVKRLAEESSNE